jgi:hypothetical protein
MAVFSSTQPSLRARILPKFPAQVLAGNGISIDKSGGKYTFSAVPPNNVPINALANINSDTLLGRDTLGIGPPESLTVGAGIGFTGAGGIQLQPNQRIRAFFTTITGAPISTGIKSDLFIPFACVITQVTLLADQVGSVVLDIWKNTFANYPPVVANSITASAKPTLASAVKSQNNTLVGWITALASGDTLRFNVISAATITRLYVGIDVTTV